MEKICMTYHVYNNNERYTTKYALISNYAMDNFKLVKIQGEKPYLNHLNKFNKNYDLLELYKVVKKHLKNENPNLIEFEYDFDFLGYIQNAIFGIAEDDLSLALELSSFFFHDIYGFMKDECLKVSKW